MKPTITPSSLAFLVATPLFAAVVILAVLFFGFDVVFAEKPRILIAVVYIMFYINMYLFALKTDRNSSYKG